MSLPVPQASGPLSSRSARTGWLPWGRPGRPAVVPEPRSALSATDGNWLWVSMQLVEASPALMALAVEDLGCQFAIAELAGRRPARRHRSAFAAWRAEVARWNAEREKITDRVGEVVAGL